MLPDLKQVDNFKLTGRLQNNFACSYSEDGHVSIISDIGIYILTLNHNLTNTFQNLPFKKSFFKPSEYAPCTDLDMDINTIIYDLPKEDLYESVLRTELSANLKAAARPEVLCRYVEWSPRGLASKSECMLGVLTNLHSLEVYIKHVDENDLLEYNMALNVTEEIVKHRKPHFKYSDRLPGAVVKLNEFKRRLEYVSPTAFTWSHLLRCKENQTYCTIFVGHYDGSISVWKIQGTNTSCQKNINCSFLGRYKSELKRICSLYWHQTTEYGGGLCMGDIEGKMSILSVKGLNKEEVAMDNEIAFCTEVDKLVDKITVMSFKDYTVIIVIKHSFLIFYGLDKIGQVFDCTVHDVKNLYISGIHHFDNILYILTFTGVFKQLEITVNFKKILVEEKIIPLKLDLVRFRTHGFFFTKQKVISGILAYPCRLKNLMNEKQFVNVFLYNNTSLNPFELLMKNDSGSLRDYWDCFEALRLTCLKEQRFPWLGLDPYLNYDTLSLLQLKTLRWIAKLSEMVFDFVPRVASYDIKPYILIHYLVDIKLIIKRINTLLQTRHSGTDLTVFQMRSIDIQNFFLKEMVVRGILAKANVGKTFLKDMKHIISIANELKYPNMIQCQWCGEKIIGSLCLPPHADTRCAISMMPIYLVPAYKCPYCKCLVHKEIEYEQDPIFCPYCDVPMRQKCTENIGDVIQKDEVKSSCFEDCLKDEQISELEECVSEYVIFSDSDTEEVDDSKLKDLYVKVANMNLDEIGRIGAENLLGGGLKPEYVDEKSTKNVTKSIKTA